jgi:GT2 family glycosyltransferase
MDKRTEYHREMNDTIILVATYFGNSMTTSCLSSILNAVTHPKILTYKNDEGWVKACNRMIDLVPNSDVILLNDDTYVTTDIVKEMSEIAYSDPSIGIVGGKALSAAVKDMIINYGIYVAPDGNTAHRFYGKYDNEVTEVIKQQAVEGSCMFIKREVINKIGAFDEGYGMGYREEVDLCFRARQAGYKVVSAPNAKYMHFTSQTNSKLGIKNDTHEYFMKRWATPLALGEV